MVSMSSCLSRGSFTYVCGQHAHWEGQQRAKNIKNVFSENNWHPCPLSVHRQVLLVYLLVHIPFLRNRRRESYDFRASRLVLPHIAKNRR